MAERRISSRQKSFLRGCVYFNNRRSSADCLVRDISETGARLIFSDAVTMPDVVELYIPQKEQTLRAQALGRNGNEIGVSFPAAQAAGADHSGEDLTERVAKLEAEIASIKRMLKKLKFDVAGADTAAA